MIKLLGMHKAKSNFQDIFDIIFISSILPLATGFFTYLYQNNEQNNERLY